MGISLTSTPCSSLVIVGEVYSGVTVGLGFAVLFDPKFEKQPRGGRELRERISKFWLKIC